jgi:uncharacterized protein involved in response to NO
MSPPIPILQATAASDATGPVPQVWPLWRLGFRPFYLGAAAFAAAAVPLWIGMLLGAWQPSLPMPSLLWHAHEMLYGFAVAVIVGFLLTAGRAWTGLETARGGALAALFLLWLAARLAPFAAPYAVYAALDVLLLPIVAALLARLLVRAGSRRNLPLALILALLALANAVFHLSVLGFVDIEPLRALHAGLALVLMIECVIAGRVVPAFTMSAMPGLKLNVPPRLEQAALACTAAALGLWVLAPAGPVAALTAVALAAAAVLHAWRLGLWQPLKTRQRPILWVLHAAYAWLPVGFAMLAAAQLGWMPASAGVHALAVGATGGLIIGMVTRTARGHTGRPLRASRWEVAAYALITAAAVLRVLLPLLAPQALLAWLVGAAMAWSAAFGIYLAIFAPWLVRTRLDGKDG